MDFAGRAIDDLGRGAEIDHHREHRALTHAHALGDFGARADERAVADDDRIGLERLEPAADAGPAREVDGLAELRARSEARRAGKEWGGRRRTWGWAAQ